mgnify:CR=1 FL=1
MGTYELKAVARVEHVRVDECLHRTTKHDATVLLPACPSVQGAIRWLELLTSLVPNDPGVLCKLGAIHYRCDYLAVGWRAARRHLPPLATACAMSVHVYVVTC